MRATLRIAMTDELYWDVADFERHPHDDGHTYRFCPRCGGTFERRLLKAGEPERLVCTTCGYIFYLDPKVAVGTIIRATAGIVLVRRAIEPGYGKWVFPGGFVDRGDKKHNALDDAKYQAHYAEAYLRRLNERQEG